MAGKISSFLSSAKLAIRLGEITLAYATNLSFSDRMAVAPVGGIGSFNPDALEPLQYSASGNMTITLYTGEAFNALNAIGNGSATHRSALIPKRAQNHVEKTSTDKIRSGNSLLSRNSFSPLHLLISRTFDIDVYERKGLGNFDPNGGSADNMVNTYHLEDCRLTTYSLTFTPGSLIQENIGFICLSITDATAETAKTEIT